MKNKFLVMFMLIFTSIFFLNIAYATNFYTFYKDSVNNLIDLVLIYNVEFKNFEISSKQQKLEATKLLYQSEKMYGLSLALPFNNFFPYSKEMMSGYSLNYTLSNPNKLKIKNSFQWEYKKSELIPLDKEISLLDLSFELRKNLINILFDNTKLKILEKIKTFINKSIDLAYTKYTYSSSVDLSDISFAKSIIQEIDYNLIKTKNDIDLSKFEIYNLLKNYSFVQESKNFEIKDILDFSRNTVPITIDLYNNPKIRKINKEIELTQLEIYVEKSKYLPNNSWMVEYMIRPNNPSMIYLKYSLSFPDKNQLKPSLETINLKIQYLQNQKISLLSSLEIRKNYLIQRLNNLKTQLNALLLKKKELEKAIELSLNKYQYANYDLYKIILSYRELYNINLEIIEICKEMLFIDAELKYIGGEIYE